MRTKSALTVLGAVLLCGAFWSAGDAWAQASATPEGSRWIGLVIDRLGVTLSHAPALWTHLGRIPALFDAYPTLALVAMVVGGLVAEFVARRALSGARRRIFQRHSGAFSLRACLLVMLLDVVALVALWAAAHLISLQAGPKDSVPGQVAHIVLLVLISWRGFNVVFRTWLRPHSPGERIAPVEDKAAGQLLIALNIVVVLPMIDRAILAGLTATGATPEIVSLAGVLMVPFIGAGLLGTVWYWRREMAAWLTAMIGESDSLRPLKTELAHDWWVAGLSFYALVGCAAFYATLTEQLKTSRGLGVIESMAIALLLLETLVYRLVRHLPAELPTLGDVVAGCVRLGARLIVAIAIVEIVFVDITGMSNAAEWAAYSRGVKIAGAAVLGAYALWRLTKYRMDSYIIANPLPVAGVVTEGEDDAPLAATRMRTLMPILRITVGITIIIIGGLIALSELGVNITPLIAGASVLGLAVSFGSQSLVKDIVSGMFFLAEDAFRVGEYVDCSKVKGTVEGFSVRSLRLRHQNGQLHIVPFGQVAHITNFSRDWTTVKFNLSFNRGTDVELLRRTTKKIGLDMMAEPAFARELLAPLKMQGIVDIKDAALVIRFKFTARPRNPTLIQRTAIRRMYEIFPEKGIEFALPIYSGPNPFGAFAPAIPAGPLAPATPVAPAEPAVSAGGQAALAAQQAAN
jgi:moderate conductance mechanosensitive channel